MIDSKLVETTFSYPILVIDEAAPILRDVFADTVEDATEVDWDQRCQSFLSKLREHGYLLVEQTGDER